MRLWHRLLRLSWRDRYLLAMAFGCLTRVRLSLWLSRGQSSFPNGQNVHVLTKPFCLPFPFLGQPSLSKLLWATNVSSRWMPGKVKCLAQALSAQAITRQVGYLLVLHIGVAKQPEQPLEAHAWLVYQGKVVLGAIPDLPRFVPLFSTLGNSAEVSK